MADHDSEALDILRNLKPALARIELDVRDARDRLIRIEATLPHMALREQVARLPGRAELWTAIAVLSGIFAVVLAALPYIERHLP
jgi:hypothetical protein